MEQIVGSSDYYNVPAHLCSREGQSHSQGLAKKERWDLTPQSLLHEQATLWVTQNYSNADHLLKTEEWLVRLKPDASEALRLAALTHDMERAFPGPDSPESDPAVDGVDHIYTRAHSERSARVVEAFLREQKADKALIAAVVELVRVHEYGGWPEADLLQAADSLSFLEVNIGLFLLRLNSFSSRRAGEQVRAKFTWMYERIQLDEARTLATPLYESALERLGQRLHQS